MGTETDNTQAVDTSKGEGSGQQKVTFTEEQQAKVQSFIDQAVGRAASTLRSELSAKEQKISALEEELAKTKEANKQVHTEKGDKKTEDLEAIIAEMKRAAQSKAEEAERYKAEALARAKDVEAAKKESLEIRKHQAMQNSASKFNFVNLEAVAKLTQDSITYDADSGRFIVLNEQGGVRLNSAMEPMTIDDFYADYASKNKYLVRGDFAGGSGSSENARQSLTRDGHYELTDIFGPKSNARLANDLAKKDKGEYRRLKALAIQAGLLAG